VTRAQIRSKHPHSPFRLQVNVTARGVFFDRIVEGEKMLMIHTSPKQARLLAQWILDNVPTQD
jgi:hypothetical protein